MIFITIKPGIHQQAVVEFRPSSITNTPLGKLAHQAVAFINERIGDVNKPETPAEVVAEVAETEPFPLPEVPVAPVVPETTTERINEPVAPATTEISESIFPPATETEAVEKLTGTPSTETEPAEDDATEEVAAPISDPAPVDETVEEDATEPEEGTRD